MSVNAARALQLAIRVSPVALILISVPHIAVLIPAYALWPIIIVAGVAATYAAVAASSERVPGESWFRGLKAFAARGGELRQFQKDRIAHARTTVKVLDSYWGDVDQFRAAIGTALTNSAGCEVRILLAKEAGHFASIRAGAIPSELLDVDRHLPHTLASLDELKAYVASQGAGRSQRVVVKHFDAIVPGPMIIVDDTELFSGTFMQNSGGSPGSPALWCKRGRFAGNDVIDSYVETFDRLWTTG